MADGDVSPICEHIILLQEVLYHCQTTVYRDTHEECSDSDSAVIWRSPECFHILYLNGF